LETYDVTKTGAAVTTRPLIEVLSSEKGCTPSSSSLARVMPSSYSSSSSSSTLSLTLTLQSETLKLIGIWAGAPPMGAAGGSFLSSRVPTAIWPCLRATLLGAGVLVAAGGEYAASILESRSSSSSSSSSSGGGAPRSSERDRLLPPSPPILLIVEALRLVTTLAAPSLSVQREPFDPKQDREQEEQEAEEEKAGVASPPSPPPPPPRPMSFGTGLHKITPYGSVDRDDKSTAKKGGTGTIPQSTTRVFFDHPPLRPFAWEAAVLITPLAQGGGDVGKAAKEALAALGQLSCDPYAVAKAQAAFFR